MKFTADKQSEVGECAEGTVPDEDVAVAELRVQQSDTRHLVRAEWGDHGALKQPRAGVEQGQYPGNRETAPGGLIGRLSESLLQGRAIGHAHSSPVDEPGPMAMPEADRVVQGLARVDEALEQHLEDGHGEPGAGLAVGRGGELEAAQAWQMAAGGVVVEDLQDEQMDGRHRVEDPVTPAASHGLTEGLQSDGFEPVGQLVTDLSQG